MVINHMSALQSDLRSLTKQETQLMSCDTAQVLIRF